MNRCGHCGNEAHHSTNGACDFGVTTPSLLNKGGVENPYFPNEFKHEWGTDAMREAWKLTHGDRRAAYGSAAVVFEGYARIWSGLLIEKLQPGITLTAADVTLMMTALKLAREANSPRADNVVDAYGYLILHEEV